MMPVKGKEEELGSLGSPENPYTLSSCKEIPVGDLVGKYVQIQGVARVWVNSAVHPTRSKKITSTSQKTDVTAVYQLHQVPHWLIEVQNGTVDFAKKSTHSPEHSRKGMQASYTKAMLSGEWEWSHDPETHWAMKVPSVKKARQSTWDASVKDEDFLI